MVTETETQTETVTEKTKGITQKSQIQVKKTNANKRTFRITSTLKDSRRKQGMSSVASSAGPSSN